MVCKKCAHESYCDMAQFGGHVPPITACSKFKEKSQTNADRIRSMTDEELAEYLCDVENDGGYAMDWLYWLKQEADNG